MHPLPPRGSAAVLKARFATVQLRNLGSDHRENSRVERRAERSLSFLRRWFTLRPSPLVPAWATSRPCLCLTPPASSSLRASSTQADKPSGLRGQARRALTGWYLYVTGKLQQLWFGEVPFSDLGEKQIKRKEWKEGNRKFTWQMIGNNTQRIRPHLKYSFRKKKKQPGPAVKYCYWFCRKTSLCLGSCSQFSKCINKNWHKQNKSETVQINFRAQKTTNKIAKESYHSLHKNFKKYCKMPWEAYYHMQFCFLKS